VLCSLFVLIFGPLWRVFILLISSPIHFEVYHHFWILSKFHC
jgi:hypothetical protein